MNRRSLETRVSRWLLAFALLLLMLPAACSDDSAGMPDGGASDATSAADGLANDGSAADRAVRPDVYIPPPTDLSKLTLYVSMGDSIAAGYGIGRGLSYAELLVANDATRYPDYDGKDFETVVGAGKVTLAAVAKSGATSTDLVEQLTTAPDNTTGDTLVTVSAGGNDFFQNFQAILSDAGAEAVAQQIFANLLKVKEHFEDTSRYTGKVTLIVFNVYDPTDATGLLPEDADVVPACGALKTFGPSLGPQLLARLAKYNDDLQAFAGQHGFVVANIHNMFLGHGFHYADPEATYYDAEDPVLWFLKDCIHPTYDGHNALRRLLWAILTGN